MNFTPSRSITGLFTVALMLALVSVPVIGQQSARLQKIEVAGLRRMTADQVITLSGLQIGQTVDGTVLDAAASKMMQSGLFRRLGYRTRTNKDGAIVTFDIEESAVSLPIVFENFVWFTDDEILAAI